jgi:hypothetical protein
MPYLGSLIYLVGLGPPTLGDVFWGAAPVPHPGVWLGVLLTVASTVGGVAGTGLLWTAGRRILQAPPEEQDSRPRLVRALLAALAGLLFVWYTGTAPFVFDRYLLPILPIVVLLGLHAAPPHAARSPVIVATIAVIGLFSTVMTREYLSWNDARDRAVRALHARGIPATDIDGGMEVNAPVHFEPYLKRTGRLDDDGTFWVRGAPYRLGFWPSRTPECTTEERYPYWTWPGGGDRAIYVLHCAARSEG